MELGLFYTRKEIGFIEIKERLKLLLENQITNFRLTLISVESFKIERNFS